VRCCRYVLALYPLPAGVKRKSAYFISSSVQWQVALRYFTLLAVPAVAVWSSSLDGLNQQGRPHSGIDDTRNIARIAIQVNFPSPLCPPFHSRHLCAEKRVLTVRRCYLSFLGVWARVQLLRDGRCMTVNGHCESNWRKPYQHFTGGKARIEALQRKPGPLHPGIPEDAV